MNEEQPEPLRVRLQIHHFKSSNEESKESPTDRPSIRDELNALFEAADSVTRAQRQLDIDEYNTERGYPGAGLNAIESRKHLKNCRGDLATIRKQMTPPVSIEVIDIDLDPDQKWNDMCLDLKKRFRCDMDRGSWLPGVITSDQDGPEDDTHACGWLAPIWDKRIRIVLWFQQETSASDYNEDERIVVNVLALE